MSLVANVVLSMAAAVLLGVGSASAEKALKDTAAAQTAAARSAYTVAEIKKIDAEQGKITLKHGPIDNLGMPSMTMVFRLAKPELANAFKPGDMVRFKAEKHNGGFVVTELRSAS